MDFQTIQKSKIVLNHKKRIGRVVYVVEGNRTEVDLLKKIYSDILGYTYISNNRVGEELKFIKQNDRYSVVYVFNSKNSNIKSIDDNDLSDNISDFIREKYDTDFNINNCAIYYLFDRDYKSNQEENVIKLIDKYKNSREISKDYDRQGLLLLSYPAIEAFIAENLIDKYYNYYFGLGYKLKYFLATKNATISKLNESTLKKGIYRTHLTLNNMTNDNYDIDNFSEFNKKIFEYEENYLKKRNDYKLLSMLSLSLIDLGLVEVRDKGHKINE